MTFLVQGAVTPDDSVSTVKIQDDAVTTAKIAANAVDETKLKDALVADFTEVTVVAGDSILLGDASDSGNTKRDTVQGILDLAGGGGSEYFYAYAASTQVVATSTYTTIVLDTELFDTGSNFNVSTYTYTVPSDGKYFLAAAGGLDELTDQKSWVMDIKVGGAIKLSSRDQAAATAAFSQVLSFSGILALSTSDAVILTVWHDNGSNRNTGAGASNLLLCGYKIGD
jgi:hypothetical protein